MNDTEPAPRRVGDREALVTVALEAIVMTGDGDALATDIVELLREMGRTDILEEAERILQEENDADEARDPETVPGDDSEDDDDDFVIDGEDE